MWSQCTVELLRMTNWLGFVLLIGLAYGCRSLVTNLEPALELTSENEESFKPVEERSVDWEAFHVAINICLFPPIFFFSGLYYTDILSTCIVLGAYFYFLQSGKAEAHQRLSSSSVRRGLVIYVLGFTALLMRQTNIFWVAIFLGGMEVVRCFQQQQNLIKRNPARLKGWRAFVEDFVAACFGGSIHDPRLTSAESIGRTSSQPL